MDINITITVKELNYLLIAAQELPGKICNPLSKKLRDQAKSQIPDQNTGELTEELKEKTS